MLQRHFWTALSVLCIALSACQSNPKPNGKLLPIRLNDKFGFIDQTGQKNCRANLHRRWRCP